MNPCATFGYGAVKDFSICVGCGGAGIDLPGVGGVSGGTLFMILLTLGTFIYVGAGAFWIKRNNPEATGSDLVLKSSVRGFVAVL